ncbi:MAG: hypothetical protein NC429_16405 [Lachnospiraceae bacterium]|nr:hypothetical protein [Lachnospiraceae bacterium]
MADLLDKLLDSIDTLSEEQFDKLLSLMKAKKSKIEAQKDKGDTPKSEVNPCVHCGSINTKKHGKVSGRQRFICKDCGKTFNTATGAITSNSRLTVDQWKELIRGVVNNQSIKVIAKNVGIARSSAWINKQKICYALMVLYGSQDSFVDIAECDEYYVTVSFKGKRDPQFFLDTLNRMPRHHMSREQKIEWLMKAGVYDELQKDPERLDYLLYSGDSYLRGISKDQTCILTCKDRTGNLYMSPTCVGRLEADDVERNLHGKFARDAIMVTDSHNAYPSFASKENIQLEQIEADKHTKGAFNLARINALHSEIAKYWPKQQERIPATKYMDLSLILFWWLKKNENLTISEKVDKLYEIVQDQHITVDTLYQEIKDRELKLNTKGYFPNRV